ncbi:MAG TPA: hypothetical protein ENJ89_01610 [Caldithrix abyssi]|uniref:T9SS type A sorting domain-containing protein n=1 Tax=Caldithrix abyssi TaxID=187145 RepID=A0A7V5PND4_CALAY|nr:hypothetical protein [Caldithrix abyssi]
MKRVAFLTWLVSLLFVLPAFSQYNPAGTDSTIDVLTWNIEWFPKDGQNTIDEVAQIITDLEGDLYGVQEISDTTAFKQLLSQLPGWDGILSPHEYSDGTYQKVGIIYNTDEVTVHDYQLLFEDDWYAFPHPPMEFTVTVTENGHTFDFKLIVVHLKAYDDSESEQRRKAAMDSLKNYIDEQLALGGEQDFILLGDFNDHLEDPPEDNIFQKMLDDSATYTFLTEPLVGIQGSYIGYNEPNLIDHICVTNDALNEYGDQGTTQVLYLDNENSAYPDEVSDHRPVLSSFAFDNGVSYTPIADIHAHIGQYLGQTVTVKGVVTIGAGIFATSYTSLYIQDSSDAGINIYYGSGLLSDLVQGVEVKITGEVANYNGLHEIKYQSHQILSTNQPLPDPWTITTVSINDTSADPGRWVTVSGEIESISGNTSMMINDGSGAGKIYFDPDAGLDISDFSVGDRIRVTGVKTVYNYEGEVQPGYQSDIVKEGTSLVNEHPVLPSSPVLYPNLPNPFGAGSSRANSQTAIRFSLPAPGAVSVEIFSATGQLVWRLTRQQAAGFSRILWRGTNLQGKPVPSGIYFYNLNFRHKRVGSGKMLLLR